MIVRVFDGRNSTHVGPFRDEDRAQAAAIRIARVAAVRGQVIVAAVRFLNPGSTSATTVLDDLNDGHLGSARSKPDGTAWFTRSTGGTPVDVSP